MLLVGVVYLTGCSFHDARTVDIASEDVDKAHWLSGQSPGNRTYDTRGSRLAGDARKALRATGMAPEDAPDIWTRASLGFQFTEQLDHPRVLPYIEHYVNHPNILQVSSARATPFAYFIVSEIERRNLPSEILLLPIVESGFAPEATSSAMAAGIWQFIPSTGTHYGLIQDPWFDGRRDVYLSTLVALDYLEALYARFGDWYLALAAYNAGQGNVARAIASNEAQGRPGDYWNLELKQEAMSYVPRLLALRAIIEEPGLFGQSLPHIENRSLLQFVDLGRQADLAYIAELAGIEVMEIRRLNPGYRGATTHPQIAHHLLLPYAAAQRLKTALAEMDEAHSLVRSQSYVVQSGDNLLRIAKSSGASVSELRRMNQIEGDLIHPGQTLRIPATATLNSPSLAEPSRSGNLQALALPLEYTVRSGDSLWSIARRLGISMQSLSQTNHLSVDSVLQPGQRLKLPSDNNSLTQKIRYEIQRGDSLALISRRFRVAIQDLRRWNDLNGDTIRAGDTLTLYLAADSS